MSDIQGAINYLLQCRGAPYTWWTSGELTEGPPAWSKNAPPPDPSEVVARGGFCAAVPNLMLRYLGIPLPSPYGDPNWDGGTFAYGQVYWPVSEWFQVTGDYPDGTLLLKQYVEGVTQGHVAICYQGYVIDSTDATGNGYPGFAWEKTVPESHAWIGYDIAVRPEYWLAEVPVEPVAEPPDEPPVPEPPPQEPASQEPELWELRGWYTFKSKNSFNLVYVPPTVVGRETPVQEIQWKKARKKKAKLIQYREVNGMVEVVDSNGGSETISTEEFNKEYDEVST
jgi:hypothetical protein